MNDLNEVQSIDNEIAALQAKKKELLDAKRTDALHQAKTLVSTFGFTAHELELVATVKASGASGKAKADAKYRNPNNPADTWHGGKGPKPKWVKAFLDNGGKLDSILIQK